MPEPKPWYVRAKNGFLKFWRAENPRVAAVRDVAVAGAFVLLLLGVIWLYTGQKFPSQAPLVVVESGSMMHGEHGPCLRGINCSEFDDPWFGRIGTIDPGDLVLVKKIDDWGDVETAFGHGDRNGYGAHGDVLVYKRDGSSTGTPVIHRGMLNFQVHQDGCVPNDEQDPCRYILPETCDPETFAQFVQPRDGTSDWRRYCEGSTEPITLDLKRGGLFLALDGFPCGTNKCAPITSGFITKGDNNVAQDQPSHYTGFGGGITCCPVRLDWVIGKARGEIPWFGLIKLSIYGNERYLCGPGESCNDPTRSTQWSIFAATAPWDIWVSLFFAIGLLIAAPIAGDFLLGRARRARRERAEAEAESGDSAAGAGGSREGKSQRTEPHRPPEKSD